MPNKSKKRKRRNERRKHWAVQMENILKRQEKYNSSNASRSIISD